MSTYNIHLYLLKHQNNRVYDQWLNKVTISTTGTSPVEKFKCIKHYLLNLSLITQVNLPLGEQLNFVNSAVLNLSLRYPTLYIQEEHLCLSVYLQSFHLKFIILTLNYEG